MVFLWPYRSAKPPVRTDWTDAQAAKIALLDVQELRPTLLDWQDHVDGGDRPDSVVGQTLKHLHDVDNPKATIQRLELLQERGVLRAG